MGSKVALEKPVVGGAGGRERAEAGETREDRALWGHEVFGARRSQGAASAMKRKSISEASTTSSTYRESSL